MEKIKNFFIRHNYKWDDKELEAMLHFTKGVICTYATMRLLPDIIRVLKLIVAGL